jgi:hypothetical protein
MSKKEEKPKQYNLSPEEVSELSFVVNNIASTREIAEYWKLRLEKLQLSIQQRLALPFDKFELSFDQVFHEGKVTAIPRPAVKVEVVKEENVANTPEATNDKPSV